MPIFMDYDGVDGGTASASPGRWAELDTFTFGSAAARPPPVKTFIAPSDPAATEGADRLAPDDDGAAARPAGIPSVSEMVVTKMPDDGLLGGPFDLSADPDAAAATSAHPGGANFAMGDGSVRFAGGELDLVLL
ncbi:MAG: DUF1559 domain-containing protein [Acetobacteraceae bacterium]|nr:DUF1559 domain-containing protein [Acetobacteraceae bacterium]